MRRPPPESDRDRRTPLLRPSADEGVHLELEHHRALLEEKLRAEGLEADDARREASRRMDTEALAGQMRAATRRMEVGMGMRWMLQGAWNDVRMGVRELGRRPGYAGSVLFALAVGIGGAALLLSLVNAIFLRPIPVPEPDRLVRVGEATTPEATFRRFSWPTLRDYRDGVGMGVDLSAFVEVDVAVSTGSLNVEVEASAVSWNYFRTLGLRPAVGRFFRADEEWVSLDEADPGSGPASAPAGDWGGVDVAVLGWDLWRTRFQGDESIVGRTVRLGGQPVTVVGVAPQGFRGLQLDRDEQVWFPVHMLPRVTIGLWANTSVHTTRFINMMAGVARLPEGVEPEAMLGRLDEMRRRLFQDLGPDVMPELPDGVRLHSARPAGEVALGADDERLRGFVTVISVLAVFVLLVGTLNALQLRLVRMRHRRSEMGVRRAIGASRGRMVRHLLADALVLAVAGVAAGVALARGVLAVLQRFTLPGGVALSRLDLRLDLKLTAMLAGIAVVALVVSSLLPAWLGARADPAVQLRRGRRRFGRHLLIAGQVAVSMVLVVSALLFLRSFVAGLNTDLGFDASDRVALTFSPAAHRQVEVTELAGRLRNVALEVPGVEEVALAAHVPVAAWDSRFDLIPLGVELEDPETDIYMNPVMGPFATMMGIPLLAGRDLDPVLDADQRSGVLNRAAAERLFPGIDPVDRFVKVFSFERDSIRIVGVVANAHGVGVDDPESPWIWVEAEHYSGVTFAGEAHLVARAAPGAGEDLLRRLQPALAAAGPEVLLLDPRTVRTEVVRALMPQHLGLLLFGIFGGVALLLAAMGVSSVVGFELASNRREMGIRRALGADWLGTVRPVLGATLGAAALGAVIGLPLVAGTRRWFESFLVQTTVLDPVSIAGTLVLVTASVAAAVAVVLPSSTRLEPARILTETTATDRL